MKPSAAAPTPRTLWDLLPELLSGLRRGAGAGGPRRRADGLHSNKWRKSAKSSTMYCPMETIARQQALRRRRPSVDT